MAVLYIFGSVLVLFLSLPYQATSEIHRIAPDEATDNCSACVTLSQLAANAAFLSNTTLIFLPGSHSLSATLNITDIDRVSIITSNSTVEITCELSTGFSIENVQYTLINNLEFVGCGSNYIKNVTEFILQDVVFEGKGESSEFRMMRWTWKKKKDQNHYTTSTPYISPSVVCFRVYSSTMFDFYCLTEYSK